MVADNPDQKIALKMFHNAIQNDHEAIAKEEAGYKPLPVIAYVSEEMVTETYTQIKGDISELLKRELDTLDKDNKTATPKSGVPVTVPKFGEKPISKKQRRQMNKHNRQRERENLRKVKQIADEQTKGCNDKSISPIRSDDTEQAMSL